MGEKYNVVSLNGRLSKALQSSKKVQAREKNPKRNLPT